MNSSLLEIRRILGKKVERMSDEEVFQIESKMRVLARAMVDKIYNEHESHKTLPKDY